ncbi:ergothioneine biosynthesis protein EgtC [Streptomyces sp. WMMC1477]|uniref:ergothioneine biosynthesis protein EgtC n=1 Tax=Streptomyces sp. WMMC1477 TaxID=3015155 RepID=UPI0022B607FA|nr:ergothioneine biosynthesis protein EgtC [Streptomyces sp. WMMC1477]MCZ7432054.1 ergothioneine biosynthesis protein EgtC [Streptomyces sp. WMMC1477]
MCRHLAYLGPPVPLARLLTETRHGLYEQSWAPRRQRHGTVNADGFGVGWYPDGPDCAGGEGGPDGPGGHGAHPARYRRAVPIWADGNLPDLARTIRSHAVLAAVRDATAGTTQDESAAAPYADGPWLFSHNGSVPDWTRLADEPALRPAPADLLAMEARCDTALLWTLARTRLRSGQPAGRVLAELVLAVAAVRPSARLNFLLTDGRTVTATRFGDTLWYRRGEDAVTVASEPDAAEGWCEVPEDSLLVATPAAVRTTPLAEARAASLTGPFSADPPVGPAPGRDAARVPETAVAAPELFERTRTP